MIGNIIGSPGQFAGYHLYHDATKTPDIARSSIIFSSENLVGDNGATL